MTDPRLVATRKPDERRNRIEYTLPGDYTPRFEFRSEWEPR